jgi:hypothetical protein
MVESLENLTRYGHMGGTSCAWSPVCPDDSQSLTMTDKLASFSSLYEDDEQTACDFTISKSSANPQAIDEVTSSNIGNLLYYGTEANTAELYSDGNASAFENPSTLQSWTPASMQPGFGQHNDCRWTTEWKSLEAKFGYISTKLIVA